MLLMLVLSTPSVAWGSARDGGDRHTALLSVPGTGWTETLTSGDPEYDALGELVRAAKPRPVGQAPEADGRGTSHPGVTITWLRNDVQPWRVDRIFLAGAEDTWVATRSWSSPGSIWDSEVSWHQPSRFRELRATLEDLGLAQISVAGGPMADQLGAGESAGQASESPAYSSSLATTDDPVAPSTVGQGGLLDRLPWALGGLAAGVLLTLGWQRRRSARDQALADPLDEPLDDTGYRPAVDQLVWRPPPRR